MTKEELLKLLTNCQDVMDHQAEALKSGIKLRIYCSYVQQFLQDINTTGKLDGMIDNLIGLMRNFDADAIEYGPYPKGQYIDAVTKPFQGEDNAKEK